MRLGTLITFLTSVFILAAAFCAQAQWGIGAGIYRCIWEPERMSRVADLTAESGAAWTREEFTWDFIEKSPGQYDWEYLQKMDCMVEAALERGVKVLGLITPSAQWHFQNPAPCTAQSRARFARFAAFLAARYLGRITHWEIWNEPNCPDYWKPAPNPWDYALLLQEAFTAIKEVDPSLVVVGLSCAGIDDSYIPGFLEAGGGHYLDILSFHPYPFDLSGIYENSIEEMELSNLGEALAEYGLAPILWATETGWPTYPDPKGVSENQQAALLARVYLSLFSQGVQQVMWYTLVTDPENASYFGMVNYHDLSPRPAYYAFQYLSNTLAGLGFQANPQCGDGCRSALMTDGSRTALALWLFDGPQSAPMTVKFSGRLDSVAGIFGEPSAHEITDQGVVVTTSRTPVLLLGQFEVLEVRRAQ